jgi:TatD DNase family protein
MIITGTSVAASRDAAALALQHANSMYSTAGIHPHHAEECDAAAIAELESLVADERVVAVGECGLDYFRNFAPQRAQRDAFEAQLQLACETGLPVFLHQRDAHEDFVAILRNVRAELTDGVAHCFTGDSRQLDAYLNLDLHIGVTGWVCDERRGHDLQSAVPGIPLERLLIETDAPYLLPRNIEPRPKTRRNEPAFLPYVVAQIAALTQLDREMIAAASTENANRLFRLR